MQELADAQDGVDQQDELEEEREVVREPGARRVENHGNIGEVCSPSHDVPSTAAIWSALLLTVLHGGSFGFAFEQLLRRGTSLL